MSLRRKNQAFPALPLRCPTCEHVPLPLSVEAELTCPACSTAYRVIRGRPVLLRADNAVFSPTSYREEVAGPRRQSRLTGVIPSLSVNLSYRRSMRKVGQLLAARDPARVLALGCGSQREELLALLQEHGNTEIVAVDVDLAADVDICCDAHDLPFADRSFDAVVTTAVLEHVLDPNRVMEEIARVLRRGGLLYSEIPFMQQVHEGAYDFTRYTLSGHRRLANAFDEIESGAVAGPGTALAWAIEHFWLSLAGTGRSRSVVKALVRSAFFWLKHLDHLLIDRPAALDAASCTFFLGRLRAGGRTLDAAIIDGYRGAQADTTHT